jgi:hypothetical protein
LLVKYALFFKNSEYKQFHQVCQAFCAEARQDSLKQHPEGNAEQIALNISMLPFPFQKEKAVSIHRLC